MPKKAATRGRWPPSLGALCVQASLGEASGSEAPVVGVCSRVLAPVFAFVNKKPGAPSARQYACLVGCAATDALDSMACASQKCRLGDGMPTRKLALASLRGEPIPEAFVALRPKQALELALGRRARIGSDHRASSACRRDAPFLAALRAAKKHAVKRPWPSGK